MMVTLADATLLAFTTCNAIRVFAYAPQIWKVAVDTDGARSISFLTWGFFLASHVTTALYAYVNRADLAMTGIFLANGACCLAILGLSVLSRVRQRRRMRRSAFAPQVRGGALT
jgi:hypothetical protein